MFTLSDIFDPCSVSGYIVGYSDQLKLKHSSDGTYFIENIPAGEQSVMITAMKINQAFRLENSSANHGKRIDEIKILNGLSKDLGAIELPEMGSLKGKSKLLSQSDHSGIDVYIPGTTYAAKTDRSGNYTFDSVPVGKQNLLFEKDGYHRGQIEGIEVTSGNATEANDIELVLSTGAEGFLIIEDGSTSSKKKSVKLSIGATKNAVLMKISESENFIGTSWRPLVTTSSYTFDSIGQKNLFIVFADSNGLQSSPFKASIYIDYEKFDNLSLSSLSTTVASLREPYIEYDNSLRSIVVWGGRENMSYTNKGTIINLSTKVATDMNLTNAPILYNSKTGMVGSYFTLWGGLELGNPNPTNKGYLYSLSNHSWTAIPTSGAPAGRTYHGLVTIGNNIVVWGGFAANGNPINDGGVFNITSGWSTITQTSAPTPRVDFGMTKVGTKVIVWGGRDGNSISSTFFNDGYLYDPSTDSWQQISSTGAPSVRATPTLLWTGSKLFVCGGFRLENGNSIVPSDCGLYDPTTNTWTVKTLANHSCIQMAVGMVGDKIATFGPAADCAGLRTGALLNASDLTVVQTDDGPSFSTNYPAFSTTDGLLMFGFSPPGYNTSAVQSYIYRP